MRLLYYKKLRVICSDNVVRAQVWLVNGEYRVWLECNWYPLSAFEESIP